MNNLILLKDKMSDGKCVLILCPNPQLMGGVSNYCNSLFKHYGKNSYSIERFIVGRRPGKKSRVPAFLTTFYDGTRLFLKLCNKRYELVHLNPSLCWQNLLREGFFILIVRLFHRKIVVFWHGWNKKFESFMDKNIFISHIFRIMFDTADVSIVLSSSFKQKLSGWGFKQKILVETTAIDDRLIENYSPAKKINEIKFYDKINILFFSRLELSKGIIETIDAFLDLSRENREVELVIAGGGPDSGLVKKHVAESGDRRIKLVGYVRGEKKRSILEKSHLMILPTSYGEGLPVAILEAMAFAMPIVTRPVGGIPDNFTEGENGYYLQSVDGKSLSKLLKKIISDRENFTEIAINNFNFARERFMASIVFKRLAHIYEAAGK